MTATNKPSLAELQRMHAIVMACEPPQYVQAAISALMVTTPVLLEIVAAAIAWQEARDASIGDAYLRCPAGPSKESQQQLSAAAADLLAALAKVRP